MTAAFWRTPRTSRHKANVGTLCAACTSHRNALCRHSPAPARPRGALRRWRARAAGRAQSPRPKSVMTHPIRANARHALERGEPRARARLEARQYRHSRHEVAKYNRAACSRLPPPPAVHGSGTPRRCKGQNPPQPALHGAYCCRACAQPGKPGPGRVSDFCCRVARRRCGRVAGVARHFDCRYERARGVRARPIAVRPLASCLIRVVSGWVARGCVRVLRQLPLLALSNVDARLSVRCSPQRRPNAPDAGCRTCRV